MPEGRKKTHHAYCMECKKPARQAPRKRVKSPLLRPPHVLIRTPPPRCLPPSVPPKGLRRQGRKASEMRSGPSCPNGREAAGAGTRAGRGSSHLPREAQVWKKRAPARPARKRTFPPQMAPARARLLRKRKNGAFTNAACLSRAPAPCAMPVPGVPFARSEQTVPPVPARRQGGAAAPPGHGWPSVPLAKVCPPVITHKSLPPLTHAEKCAPPCRGRSQRPRGPASLRLYP